MTIDVYLTERELSTLEEGGFIKLSLPDGLEILIRKEMYEKQIGAVLTDASIFKDERGLYLSLTYEHAEFEGTKKKVIIPKVRLPIPTNHIPVIDFRTWSNDEQLCYLHLISGAGENFRLTIEPTDFTVKNTLGKEAELKNEVFVEILEEKKITVEEAEKTLREHFGCPVKIVKRSCENYKYSGLGMHEIPCQCCDKKSKWEWKKWNRLRYLAQVQLTN